MKNTFLYLFILSLLLNIFQYVNSNKILDAKEEQVQLTKERLKIARDSISIVGYNDYFDIEKDQDAQDYFYSNNLDYLKVMQKVNEDILDLNTKPNGNPLIPYEPIDGKNFIINKAKVLNHRWIIAEFSNTELWGQILVKYFHNEDKPTDFETVETILYEKQKVQ
ncbi:hydrolase [Flavobacterium jejuense]|uniref:Hydrolase n=1 Tax=Flavobacterium jejuense TaxID=1544455 RepID=A0ABX0INM0_9FLAO|nr:hydrolase [Flavobacterium jejuense]NHN24826.1 hydrolase [Flavobacterium jejuense]